MMISSEPATTAPACAMCRPARAMSPILIAIALTSLSLTTARAAEPAMDARIQAMLPELERVVADGMKAFDMPGLAIGIVRGDRLVYAKGLGVGGKADPAPVDTRTVFQIGSVAKSFLATTMAIAVDRGTLRWDDPVVDLHPGFQFKDPWVTREFRAYDLLAQRSGLPPYVNDVLAMLGYDEPELIRSLRYVEPVSSFRTTFAYTNITHLLAGRIVADREGAPDWNTVARRELLEPLGMTETSFTAEAIKAAANHAQGHRWTPDGTIAVPIEPLMPYRFGPAGNINSNIEDMARWARLQLANGTFEGRRLVSQENLAYTRTPKVAMTDKASYALGWAVVQTPNGSIVTHDGGTAGFGAQIGLLLDKDVAVIVLSNTENMGLPGAITGWTVDRLLDNPAVDHVAEVLKQAKSKFARGEKLFAKPEAPRPFPTLAPLAGDFVSPALGKAFLRVQGDALVLELQATGAELALKPWDGDVFTFRQLPRGRFADVVEGTAEQPYGFAQFALDAHGKLGLLRLSFDDGQAYEFRRD